MEMGLVRGETILVERVAPLAEALLADHPGASRPLIRRWLGEEAGRYGQV